MKKDVFLITPENNKINISLFGLKNLKESPAVILVHGFKGFKDWGFFPYTAEKLSLAGFFVLSFNFSHNGVEESKDVFSEFNKFAQNTISLELNELNFIIDSYFNGFFGETTNKNLGLVGHSRGAGLSILATKFNRYVKTAVCWGTIKTFDRYTNRQKKLWIEKGFFEFENSRTNQIFRMNKSFLEDLIQNDELNIIEAIKNIDKNILLIHGEQDLTVPIEEAQYLIDISRSKFVKIEKIPNAGHTFDITHPFQETNNRFEAVLKDTEIFLKENLITEK